MTIVGMLGVLLGLLAFPFAFVRRTPARVSVFFLLFFVQVGAGIFYYIWAQTNTSDSPFYYYDQFGFYGQGFGLNTRFVIYLIQTMKAIFGGTYFDYFLVFQGTGFWASVFLMRIFEEAADELGVIQPKVTYLLLFLPSLHFFTASIGKDGPLVLASAMAVWAVMQFRKRLVIFGLAIIIMVLFRPHIALIAMVAVSIATFFDARSRMSIKVFIVAFTLLAASWLAATVQVTFEVDVTSSESLGDFFATQSETAQQFDTGTAVLGASYPFRLFSLLFRPFFIDAGGALGIVASLENILMLAIVGTMVFRLRDTILLIKNVFFVRFSLIFALALILLLAMVYYNVGLGLRQRTMVLPALLAYFVVMHCIRRARRSQVRVESHA